MFIDTHCHLYDKKIENIAEVVKRAEENNVKKMIVAGIDLSSSQEAVNLAKQYSSVFANVGIYPESALDVDEKLLNNLYDLAQYEKVVGIGEIGLDYNYEVDRKIQQNALLKQIELAFSLKKPFVLHGRDAYGDAVNLLKQNKNLLAYGGTFHCYTGSRELAKEIIKLDLHISVGGVSTFSNAKNVQEMICYVPTENILLETDAPYLAPTPMRGKVNEPSFIPYIAQNLARLKCCEISEIEEKTTKNAEKLFKF